MRCEKAFRNGTLKTKQYPIKIKIKIKLLIPWSLITVRCEKAFRNGTFKTKQYPIIIIPCLGTWTWTDLDLPYVPLLYQKGPGLPGATMDSTTPAKKRKAADPTSPGNDDDDTGSVLSANLPLSLSLTADLHKLVDQRVADAVDAKTLALSSRVDDLRRENEGLLRRCESLERSVQVLRREGSWTYTAPDVPRSHWIEQGHDDEYAECAEMVTNTIKRNTESLRADDPNYSNIVAFGFVDFETVIRSDPVLDPHLKELAKATFASITFNWTSAHSKCSSKLVCDRRA